jgi:tRNA-dihydrouridine synthase 1
MLERAGAQILTCHGRTREQRGQRSVRPHLSSSLPPSPISSRQITQGLADWAKIRAVKDAVSVPVFANGNILFNSDIATCLEATGADAVMSAEGQLYNAALFAPASSLSASLDTGLHLPHADLALEYLAIVKELKTRTSLSAVKGHLFKLMRPALARETDLREKLGKIRSAEGCVDGYVEVVEEMKRRMDVI